MTTFFIWLLLGGAGGIVVLAVSASIQKSVRTRNFRQNLKAEAEFRPLLIELLAQDEPDLASVEFGPAGRSARSGTFDQLVGGMMRKLRGSDRQILHDLLETRGVFEQSRLSTRSRRPAQRIRAAELLGDCKVHAALPDLTNLLTDRNNEVRKAAARAIGKFGDPTSIPGLMAALTADQVPLSVVGMAIVHIGPSGNDALRSSLTAEHPQERLLAADCLGMSGALEALPDLIALVEREQTPEVLQTALRALGRIGSPSAIQQLVLTLTRDVGPSVRAEAATALGRIGSDDALAALGSAALDREPSVIRAATESLTRLREPGIDRLRVLSQSGGQVGAFAREALDTTGPPRGRIAA